MLLAKERAADRRQWLEEKGNEAEARVGGPAHARLAAPRSHGPGSATNTAVAARLRFADAQEQDGKALVACTGWNAVPWELTQLLVSPVSVSATVITTRTLVRPAAKTQ